jgi:hypothetical protein
MAKHSTSTYVLEIPPPFEKEEILPVHEEGSLVIRHERMQSVKHKNGCN